jgi:hypothetical protein
MSKYQEFIFERYEFDNKTLSLYYSFDEEMKFCETFIFDFDFADYNHEALDRAFQLLFFLAGVSYYKAYLAKSIVVKTGQISSQLAHFLSKTYQKGLGELFYVNQLDPQTPINFPTNTQALEPIELHLNGQIIGIGGGKDSLVSVEALRHQEGVMTWSLKHRLQLTPLIERIGLPHAWVDRQWDPQINGLTERDPDAYNGHVPISAIFAAVGTIICILTGRRDHVVSNEQSANEPTLHYRGTAINHQYSKSQEFEKDFQAILQNLFGDSLRYYSCLRPLSELRVAEIFSNTGFEKYKDVFSSCNRAFTHDSPGLFWDGKCPKCAFVFLALTPFIDRAKLEKLFNGKNLLLDPELETTYRNLLGIEGEKPLECVGEVKESRSAMELAKKQYPELNKYHYDLPDDYDYKTLATHLMPTEVWQTIQAKISNKA